MHDHGIAAGVTDTVLILIPSGQNGEGAASLLTRNNIACRVCPDIDSLALAIDQDAGAVLIAEDALWAHGTELLTAQLTSQPFWSDLPFIVLTRAKTGASQALMERNLPDKLGNVVFLETPLGTLTLLSAVRSALRARRRQRQVGRYLADQKIAAAALRESEARFRQMADSAPALIWMTDAEGRGTFVNMHHRLVFGQRTGELLRLGWATMVMADDRDRYEAEFRSAFRTRTPFATKVRIRDKHHCIRWVHCEGVPRMDDGGRFLGYTGCCLDITDTKLATEELERRVHERTAELSRALSLLNDEVAEREKAEAALRQAQKIEAIGQLTGGIAHDFNNMLQGISGSLELLEMRIAQGRHRDAVFYIGNARQSLERAARLTHRLLAFARRQTLQPVLVEPGRLVRGMEELIRRTVGPAIRLALDQTDSAWCVLCDPSQLESAVLNLCINARDAMPEGGTLTVTTVERVLGWTDVAGQDDVAPGRYVELSVSDTGVGMPPEVVSRAFEPFFTTKPFGQGTGLGLSQLYGFLRQSGGFVRLESLVGTGTTVRMWLPWHADADNNLETTAERQPASGLPPPEPVDGGGPIVLVVEDETEIRTLISETLRGLHCRVLEAEDGPSGLKMIRAHERIDLLLTDVGLPGLNGRQLADAAREGRPNLPVLLITGFSGTALADMGTTARMDVMVKPFALDALAARVQALLSAAASSCHFL